MSKKNKTQKNSNKSQTTAASINAPASIKKNKNPLAVETTESSLTPDKPTPEKQKENIKTTLTPKSQSEQISTSAKKSKSKNITKPSKTIEKTSVISQPISETNEANTTIVETPLPVESKTVKKKGKKAKQPQKAHKEPKHEKTPKLTVQQIAAPQTAIQPESSTIEHTIEVSPPPKVDLQKNLKTDEELQIPVHLEKSAATIYPANEITDALAIENQQSDLVDIENSSFSQAHTAIADSSFVSDAVRLTLAPTNFFETTFLNIKKAIKFCGISSGIFFITFLLWSLKMNRGKFLLETGKEILGLLAFFTLLTAAALTIHYAALLIKKKLNLNVTEKITDSISITLYSASSALNLLSLSFILIILYNIWLMLCGALSVWDYNSIIVLKGAAIIVGAYASFILYQATASVYAISETQAALACIIPMLILIFCTYKLI